jgi:hypothetical protein
MSPIEDEWMDNWPPHLQFAAVVLTMALIGFAVWAFVWMVAEVLG